MEFAAVSVFTKPLTAIAVDGEIVIHGPGMRGASFTPEAAMETCENVKAAAEEAFRQLAATSAN